MDFKLRLFSLILISVNLNFVQGYGCKFNYNEYFSYVCDLKPDEWLNVEQHISDKMDDDVKRVEFKAYSSADDKSKLKNTFNICERFKNLEEIEIWYFFKIDPNFLKSCKNLRNFYASRSEFLEIPEDFLVNNRKLTSIRLEDNNWSTLPERLFANQKELTEILLSHDQIKVLPPKIFKPIESLKSLYLFDNKIQSLDPEWFRDLHNLEVLDLSNNQISDLPKNIFSSLDGLHRIHLFSNKLTTIHSDSFGNHPNLKFITLFNNKINAFDKKILDIKGLEEIDMFPNICTNNLELIKLDIPSLRQSLTKCFENYQPRQEK